MNPSNEKEGVFWVSTQRLQTYEANIERPQNILDKIVISFCSAVCFIMAIILIVIITAAALCRYIFEIDMY
ncbi:MAG: hypothetical protein ACLUEQ_01225, partial [Cloacibacillus evryensis]